MFEVTVQSDPNNDRPFSRLNSDLGLKWGGQNPSRRSLNLRFMRLVSRDMIERRVRKMRNLDNHRLSATRFNLGRIDGKKNSFEASKGRSRRGVRRVDPREINARQKRKEREDNETEVRIRGKVSFVKPLAEGVGARAGKRRRKGGGDVRVSFWGREKGNGRAVGVG